jgi:hypothetical protein
LEIASISARTWAGVPLITRRRRIESAPGVLASQSTASATLGMIGRRQHEHYVKPRRCSSNAQSAIITWDECYLEDQRFILFDRIPSSAHGGLGDQKLE